MFSKFFEPSIDSSNTSVDMFLFFLQFLRGIGHEAHSIDCLLDRLYCSCNVGFSTYVWRQGAQILWDLVEPRPFAFGAPFLASSSSQ